MSGSFGGYQRPVVRHRRAKQRQYTTDECVGFCSRASCVPDKSSQQMQIRRFHSPVQKHVTRRSKSDAVNRPPPQLLSRTRLSRQTDQIIDWLGQHEIYGIRSFESSVYDHQVSPGPSTEAGHEDPEPTSSRNKATSERYTQCRDKNRRHRGEPGRRPMRAHAAGRPL